jgi:beta-mannosidase
VDRSPRSSAVRWHDKTGKGYDTYLGYITLHFPEPRTLEDLVYYSQLNQLEALKFGVEGMRRRKGQSWGSLIWQLQDCWPVQSWAMIDYSCEPKASWYGAGRFYAPVLLSLVRSGPAVEAHVVNDLLMPLDGAVKLTLTTMSGETLAEDELPCDVGANAAVKVGQLDLSPARGREEDVFVHGEFVPRQPACGKRLYSDLLLAEPKDLRIADPGVTLDVVDADESHFSIALSAKRLAPYLWLRLAGDLGERPTTLWDDNFFHLLPGQTRTVRLRRGPGLETPEAARSRLRVRWL